MADNRLKRVLSAILAAGMLLGYGALGNTEGTSSFETGTDNYAQEEVVDAPDDMYAGEIAPDSQYVTLKRGDKDGEDSAAHIVLLQNRLIDLGYLMDDADGTYGANTEEAVAQFQKLNGLPETGEADERTQQLIFSDAELVTADAALDSKSTIYRVQTKLIQWGFMTGKADGKNGSTTRAAITKFKEYMKGYLELYPTPSPEPTVTVNPAEILGFADGEIVLDVPIKKENDNGDVTQDILDFVDGKYEFKVFREKVKKGDKGDEALRVQKRLRQLKYLYIADGSFGENSERALLYFQKKNGLDQSGVADEATQNLLFSDDAIQSEEYVNPYKLVVDISEQRVYLYEWDGSGYDTYLGKCVCSTGKSGTDTPLGTYQSGGPSGTGEWYYFKEYNCYAKWAYRIVGGIMFHSVTYNSHRQLISGSVSNLGRRASHGCIRLEIAKAEWIYKNCPTGTTVIIQE